jgi:hypothetical protein
VLSKRWIHLGFIYHNADYFWIWTYWHGTPQ